MTSEMKSKMSFQPQPETFPSKDQDTKNAIATSHLTKEARQQYLINEIKKLVEDCDDFIGLVAGPGGVPEIVVSPNLKKDEYTIIGEAHSTYIEYLSYRPQSGKDKSCEIVPQCVRPFKQESPKDFQMPSGSISLTIQRPLKRHRSRVNTSRDASNSRARHGGGGARVVDSPAVQIEVRDHERLAKWYKDAFVKLQQVACRLVAKAWIKKIHPKKQSTNPYNGKMPRNTPPDPSLTRPDYWPPNVQHKEPDHIGRDERTQLLVHLIMNTPQLVVSNPLADPENRQYVYSKELSDCLEPKRGNGIGELNEERWDIIQQILKAREVQERYEAGEKDDDTKIFLRDYSENTASRLRTLDSDEEEEELDGNEAGESSEGSEAAGEDREATPASSTTSPIDQPSMSRPKANSSIRSSRDTIVVPRRRIANCRPRPSFSVGQQTPTMVMRAGPSFGPGKAMSLETGMAHSNANMLPLVGLHQQLGSGFFGHTHPDATEIISAPGHIGHHAGNLHMQAWSEIMPDMGPDPPPEMFAISQSMTPTAMRHSYFGPETLDMSGNMQSGIHSALASPAQYQDFVEGRRRALPFRAAEAQHPHMMSTQDVNMEMMSGHFY